MLRPRVPEGVVEAGVRGHEGACLAGREVLGSEVRGPRGAGSRGAGHRHHVLWGSLELLRHLLGAFPQGHGGGRGGAWRRQVVRGSDVWTEESREEGSGRSIHGARMD